MILIRCVSCDQLLDSSFFHKKTNSKLGFRTECKACRKAADKEKYLVNKDEIYQKRKEYWDKVKDKPEVIERCRRNRKSYFLNNQEKFILHRCKVRAKKAGLDFDLELSDIVIPEICPVLNIPLEKGDRFANRNSPSVDRIDPNRGYTKDNIQIISNLANMMKNNANPEQLLNFANWILRTYSKTVIQ